MKTFFAISIKSFVDVIFIFLIFNQTVNAQINSLPINEFMADNQSTLADEDGDFSDWIELYNPTSVTVSLNGWSLTDDLLDTDKWVFPAVQLEPNQYLLVFASGKNKKIVSGKLHTNFKLSQEGEYLALYNASHTVVTQLNPSFPAQQTDVSYGYFQDSWLSFADPTPGEDNNQSVSTLIPAPEFSKPHGFCDTSFDLAISCSLPGVQIYYTTDGSTPSSSYGKKYQSAIQISSTTIIRAIAYFNGNDSSTVSTQTYLLLNDVIHQPNNPAGYPSQWGKYCEITGTAIADYEMDPVLIENPDFSNRVKHALQSIPTISLVSDKGNFFSTIEDSVTGGIYIFTGAPVGSRVGEGWERPASAEFFTADGKRSFQINCGVELEGGHSRLPDKSPKHSFQLKFKKMYGPGKLNFPIFGSQADSTFDNLVLRAGYGSTWINRISTDRSGAVYIRDIWAKDTQRAMGDPSCNGTYVHLYINGMYWGIYNPLERMDADFASFYMDGASEDFDVIKDKTEIIDGDKSAWNLLLQYVKEGLKTTEAYQKIQGKNPDGTRNPNYESLLDVENLINFMLINYYGGNTDWDEHNWAAMRNRVNPGKGFKFLCWDTENNLKGVEHNNLNVNYTGCPSSIFNQLMKNEDFKRLFANHVAKHCFDNGVLTPQSNIERFLERSSTLEGAIDAESARWGDYRRDVHRYFSQGPFELYSKDDHWLPAVSDLVNNYFPKRTDIFLSQLKSKGWYPNVDAPLIRLNGNIPMVRQTVFSDDKLTLEAAKGTIYYTMNGSDPVNWNSETGVLSSDALIYSGAVSLNHSCLIRARAFYNGKWSAMKEASFIFPADLHDLKITEINYHPSDEDTNQYGEPEFIEIKNTGKATLDLSGAKFVNGMEYLFPVGTTMLPGCFIVIASNERAFYTRYGFMPFGEYNGKLDNKGEWILLVSSENDTICSFIFSDGKGWPNKTDGSGFTLVPTQFNPDNDQTLPQYWRNSISLGGSPGTDDAIIDDVIAFDQYPVGDGFSLRQNYPNPFSESTCIDFTLSAPAQIKLTVFNLMGQQLAVLTNKKYSTGLHQVVWETGNNQNNYLSEGILFYRMDVTTDKWSRTQTKKMMLMKK